MNAPVKVSVLLAVCALALGAGGCARMGGNAAGESLAAARSSAATSAAVSFTQADLDGDARITRQEFDLWRRGSGPSGAGALAAAGGTGNRDAFDAADANANGVLTLDEWQAMMTPSNAAAGAAPAPPSRAR